MIKIRKSENRGQADLGWLKAKHSFSFGSYYDPENMGFSKLRVINQDQIAPGGGFPTHPHKNMEIITYITQGMIEHKDSMGNKLQIQVGEVQAMTAGTGIAHSEFNPDSQVPLHLLQIWIEPDKSGHKPQYDQKTFGVESKKNCLKLMVSGDDEAGALKIHQDVKIYGSLLGDGQELRHIIGPGRKAWIQVISGSVDVNGMTLEGGDGASFEEVLEFELKGHQKAEFLFFDLP